MTESDGGARPRRRARVGLTGARFPRSAAEDAREDAAEDAPEDNPEDNPEDTAAEVPEDAAPDADEVTEAESVPDAGPTGPEDPEVGRTGVRFNSRGRRARRAAARVAAEDAAVPAQTAPPARPEPEPESEDAPTLPLFLTAAAPLESTRTRVRPYIRTRGRTRSRADLALETLVSIPSPRPPLEDPEHVALGDVVGDPRSVAEVAALLSVPLGVARVIIDDMAGAGLLLVHPRAVAATGAPSRDVMQRVLDGLHRL